MRKSYKQLNKKSVNKTRKNKKKSKPYFEDECRIIVSYGTKYDKPFPNYKMSKFPKSWVYNGYEGALDSQPKWQTTNAYYFGPKMDIKKAKESIIKLYDKYQKNNYISKYKVIIK